jgi:hypothetical protein
VDRDAFAPTPRVEPLLLVKMRLLRLVGRVYSATGQAGICGTTLFDARHKAARELGRTGLRGCLTGVDR